MTTNSAPRIPKYGHYNKPTLGSVLDQYSDVDSYPNRHHKTKKRVEISEKDNTEHYFEPSEKSTFTKDIFESSYRDAGIIEEPRIVLERRKIKDQRLLDQLSPPEKDRYLRYLTFHDDFEKKREHKSQTDVGKRAESNKVKSRARLDKVKLQTDDSFLKNVPKSVLYRLVQMEKELTKRGLLKYQCDRDTFWVDNLSRKKNMKVSDYLEESGDSADDQDLKSHKEEVWREVQTISERDEDSRPTTHRTIGKDGRYSGKELSILFPKIDAPTLRCFDLDLTEKQMTEEEAKLFHLFQKRQKRRKKRKEVKLQMYDIAQAHSATAKRMLEEQFEEYPNNEPTSLSDFTTYERAKEFIRAPPVLSPPPILAELPSNRRYRWYKEETLDEIKAQMNRSQSRAQTESQQSSYEQILGSRASTAVPVCVPLTFEESAEIADVKVPQRAGVNWNNYLRSGTIRFAPIDESTIGTQHMSKKCVSPTCT